MALVWSCGWQETREKGFRLSRILFWYEGQVHRRQELAKSAQVANSGAHVSPFKTSNSLVLSIAGEGRAARLFRDFGNTLPLVTTPRSRVHQNNLLTHMELALRSSRARPLFYSSFLIIKCRQMSIANMSRTPDAVLAATKPVDVAINAPRDPNTLSNYSAWRTTHTAVDFRIDFTNKLLTGTVKLKLRSITDAQTPEVVLDTRYDNPQ